MASDLALVLPLIALTLLCLAPGTERPSRGAGPGSTHRVYTTRFPLTENPISEGGQWLKPIALLEDIIRAAAPSRGLLLDPFAGSGSAPIAAERTGRTCYAAELEPRYCAIIVARWEALSGSKAGPMCLCRGPMVPQPEPVFQRGR